uniref:Uncharacterized protein n=1 Tax=Ditylenchus dipsaci TaxID=166011 RepID=A0A915EQ06_9BILA
MIGKAPVFFVVPDPLAGQHSYGNLVDPRKLPGYCGEQDIDEICSRIEGMVRDLNSEPKLTKNGRRGAKPSKVRYRLQRLVPKPACEDRHEEAPPGSHVASVEENRQLMFSLSATKIPNPFAGTKQRTMKLKLGSLFVLCSPEDHRNMSLWKTK